MSTFEKFLKRCFDILVSTIGIVVLLIPWIIISIIIKVESPGPVIFKAQRIGLGGEPFTLLKFRSMRVDSGQIHKTTLRGDPRIYPFGRFLRKSKLDETLQFINILRNDMSVVGPRPEDDENAEEMYVGQYKRILSVKPGLSSPASLYDYTHGEKCLSEDLYQKVFLPQKLMLELYYVDHQSCRYDLKIVFKTVITILQILTGKADFSEPKELENLLESKTGSRAV